MSDFKGWIKLDRRLLEWEWFDDPNTLSVWIYLLLNANIEPTSYKGKIIDRGCCHTTIPEIAKKCGISERSVRTALFHLKNAEQLTYQKSRNFSIVSILRYDEYQSNRQNKRQNSGQNNGQNLFINKKHSKECKKEHTLLECDSKRNGQSDANGVKASHPLSKEKEFVRNIPLLSWDDD